MTDPIAILVLDPDEKSAAECTAAFRSLRWRADHASTFVEAAELIPQQHYDVVIIDLILPDRDGIEAWSRIRAMSPTTNGIMTTSSTSLRSSVFALEPGILTYLQKPLQVPVLCEFIDRAVKSQHMTRETRDFERELLALSNLLSSASHGSGPEQILKKTMAHLQSMFRFDRVVMYLLNEDKASWTEVVQPRHLPQKEGVINFQSEFIQQRVIEVVHSLQPQFMIQCVSSALDSHVPALRELGVRDLVLIPVIGTHELFGVLAITNYLDSDATLSRSDAASLSVVGQAIALALDRERLGKELGLEGIHGSVTGVYTPAYLCRLVEIEVARWKRHARYFSLVMIDMASPEPCRQDQEDQARLRLFREVAGVTKSLVRRSDVVAQAGDWQLAILLPETELAGAQRVINRVEEALQGRLEAADGGPIPSIKTRAVIPSENIQSLDELVRSAHA